MKPMEEMIRAVRDWVNSKVDPDTILRKTGDASKVVTTLNYDYEGMSTDLKNGEELGVSLAKINIMQSGLKKVAFSGLYKDLRNIPLLRKAMYNNSSITAAYTESILYSAAGDNLYNTWLVIGSGGSVTTAGIHGTTDFARAYLIIPKIESDSVSDRKGRTFILLQLGSSGSTARYTLTPVAATDYDNAEKITLTIPKGSYADVTLYELPSNYVG